MASPKWTNFLLNVPNFETGYQVGPIQFLPYYTQNITVPAGDIVLSPTTPPTAPQIQTGTSIITNIPFEIYTNVGSGPGNTTFTVTMPYISANTETITNPNFVQTTSYPNITISSISTTSGSDRVTFVVTTTDFVVFPPGNPASFDIPYENNTYDNSDY